MNKQFTDAMKGFDFSPWGGLEGFLKATSNGAGGSSGAKILKRLVPDLSKAENKTATAVSSLPFAMYKGDNEVDTSKNWKNVAGGLDDPLRTIYLLAAALCGGAAYLKPFITSKAIVDLQYIVPYSITPEIDMNGLQWFDRNTDKGLTERLQPDELLYFWLPDSDVEIGPALNTPLSAAMTDAAVILNAVNTMKIYGERGWVPITVLAAKNMPNEAERQKAEGFFNRLLQGGFDVLAKIINSEALSIERLGAGMDELKGSYLEIKRESAEGVAKAFGIPSALMLSDNAFASEYKELRLDWYNTSQFRNIYHTIQGVFNSQLFTQRGYTFKFNIEELDIFQEDEASRSASLVQFVNAFSVDPEVASFGMDFLGYELTQEQEETRDELIAKKQAEKEEAKRQFEQQQKDKMNNPQPFGNNGRDEEKPKPFQRKAFTPDEIKDIALWFSKAKAWHAKGKSAVDWECKHLPEEIAASIRMKLASAETELDIVKAFEIGEDVTPIPQYESEIITLANAINGAAEKL